MPKRLKMVLPVIKKTILTFLKGFWILKGIKIAVWVKSYVDFAAWDLDWWSCIWKGLRLQPAKQACLKLEELSLTVWAWRRCKAVGGKGILNQLIIDLQSV